MNGHRRLERSDAGVALITALALLFLFSLLGGAYVSYMVYEKQQTDLDVSATKSRLVAEAGVQAAIGALGAALKSNADWPKTLEVPMADYVPAADGKLAVEGTAGQATVTIADENGRVNLNLAPTRVLAAILKIDHGAARTIQNTMPRQESDAATASPPGERRWLASVDELVTRGLLDPERFAALDKNLLTVYSTGSADPTLGHINVNSAPPEVLAAVLALTPEEAVQVAAKRPFKSMEDLVAATGKDPATFNVSAPAETPGALPKELAFTSRCFRVVSESALAEAKPGQRSGYRVEAVVAFNDAGEPSIRYWNLSRGEAVATATATTTATTEAPTPESATAESEPPAGAA